MDIVRVAAIHKAGAGDLTFVSNARYLPELATTRASAVILGRVTGAAPAACAVLRTDDPYTAFAHAVSLFAPAGGPLPGVDPLTLRFTDLRERVLALDGFDDDAKISNEPKLEAIQMAWYEEWKDAQS